jgi:pilus assembly protein FimV
MHTKSKSSLRTQLQTTGTTGSKWRVSAVTAALGVLMGMVHVNANALALGRITALSSLGEPFVAGIEVPDINAEEIASLKVAIASPDAFRDAGLEYSAALVGAQVSLSKRSNGSSYLLVRTDKIVTDPFLNLVINVTWAKGNVTRNYTLLLDPPAARPSDASIASAIAALPAPTPAPAPATTTSSAPAATTSASSGKPATAVLPKSSARRAPTTNTGDQVKVAAGDTAGKIAANNLPANVSLDQMLASILRGNPQAFIGNNINRLKAGAVLDLPTAAEATAITTAEARRTLVGQSKDFNSFRRKLAENAPAMASKSNDRVASGKIDANVEDKKAPAIAPDKLTLSKGGLKADDKAGAKSKGNLEKIAKDRQAKDDAARSAELAKNIKDLNKIAGSAPAAAPAAPVAPAATAATAAIPVAPVAAAAATTTPATAPTATTPVEVTPAPVVVPPVAPTPVVKAPVVAPKAEVSFLDGLLNSDLVKPIGGGLLALLLGGGLFAYNQRKKRLAAEAAEDALMDSRFADESFFNETTNEPVVAAKEPTFEAAKPVVAAVEQPAPVFTKPVEPVVSTPATEVDPLTEADVLLDYGRDVQAEEILKATLKTQPDNALIYTKLMGIYSKRRDAKNFEQMALKAKLLLTENDPQWETISKQGFDLEPTNPLYSAAAIDPDDTFAAMTNSEFSTRTVAQLSPDTAKSPASVDLDLDFDFVSSFPAPVAPEAPKSPLVEFPDFSLEPETAAAPAAKVIETVAPAAVATALAATATSMASPAAKPAAMDYDMSGLSLDLNAAGQPPAAASNGQSDEVNARLETKLALAQEFRSIGDNTGAKMLVNEVISNATGPLKQKAEKFLTELS